MPSLLESVTDLLGQGEVFATLGQLMGGDRDQAEAAAGVSVPALIGGLASQAAADDGPAAITELLDGADSGPVDDVAAFLDAGDETAGSGMLDTILGDDRSDLISALAEKADVDGSMVTKLLPMLAPVVVGRLAKQRTEDKLDDAGVATLLAAEKESLEGDGLLDTIGDLLTGGLGKAAGAAAAAAGAGAMIGSAAKDKAGDLGDAAGDAAGAVADAAGDAVGAVAGVAGGAADAVTDAAADAKDAAADAKDAVVTKLGGVKDSVAGGGGVGDDRNGGLGWLWWALGAVVLVLLLAWALSMCNEESETTADTGSGEVADETEEDIDGGDGDDADDDAMADDDDADADADDDAMADEDAGADTDTDTDADSDAADGDTDVDSADADDDADADDADADAAAAAEANLQLVLAAALDGSGVTAMVSGGVVTLSGTADSTDVKEGLVLAIEAIEGVTSVDDQIEVAGSSADEQDDEADQDASTEEPEAGDTINALLDLDPVTFRVSSSRITDTGQAVLDEAAAFLDANPDVAVEIGGHTDDDGTVAENQVLSQLRADSVKAYLESKGIDGDRMEAVGYGEERPKVANDSASGKAENRRIEFVIL